MAFIASTFIQGLTGSYRGYFSGGIFSMSPGALPTDVFSDVKWIQHPHGCSSIEKLASGDNYGPRQYLTGLFSVPVVIDEEMRANRQGMRGPDTKPSVSVGAGTTPQVCYWRFFDEVTGERSPLSDGLSVTGNTTRTWTNLPTEEPGLQVVIEGTAAIAAGTITGSVEANYGDLRPGDRIADATALTRWARIRTIASPTSMVIDDTGMALGAGGTIVAKLRGRATHIELWVSANGALPRLAMRVRIGTVSIVESTPSLALGEAETLSFERIPIGDINIIMNDRQMVAGVQGQRDHVFLSAIGFPERYEGLSFRTKYGEPIVGLVKYRDYVLVLCPDSSYRLQGYTDDDYVLTVQDAKIGGLGHQCNAVTDTIALIPSRKGILTYNGAFHQALADRRTEWALNLRNFTVAYQMGLGAINPSDETYQFFPWVFRITASDGSFGDSLAEDDARVWVGTYSDVGPDPQAAGDVTQPEWSSDTYTTPKLIGDDDFGIMSYMKYMVPKDGRCGVFYRGDSLGRIYEEEMLGDEVRAQAVAFHGESVIVPGHIFNGELGGNLDEGKRLLEFWSYVMSEFATWKLYIWPGDEWAYPPRPIPFSIVNAGEGSTNRIVQAVPKLYVDTVPVGFLEGSLIDLTVRWQRKTVRVHQVEGAPVSGRGFTFEYRFLQPKGAQFYGFGGIYEPGKANYPAWLAAAGE